MGARRAPGGLEGESAIGSQEERVPGGRAGPGGSQGHTGRLVSCGRSALSACTICSMVPELRRVKNKTRGDMAWAEDFQNERQEAIEHVSDKITSR